MNITKKTSVFIGTAVAVILVAALLFLPVIPVVYAGSSTQSPICGDGQWLPFFNTSGQPPQNFVKFSNLSLGLSFAFQNDLQDVRSHILNNGTYRQYTTHTNQTLALDLVGFKIAHNNGTLASFNFASFINRSLDSRIKFTSLSVVTAKFNSTTFRINVTIAHVTILIGPWSASHGGNTWGLPVGIPISFDNLRIVWFYNCATGKTGYSFSSLTNGVSVVTIIGHRLMGSDGLPHFFR